MGEVWLAHATPGLDVRSVNPGIMARNLPTNRRDGGPTWAPLWDKVRSWPVALKVIRPDLADDAKALLRFAREVRAADKVAHWERFARNAERLRPLRPRGFDWGVKSAPDRSGRPAAAPVAWQIHVPAKDDRSQYALYRWLGHRWPGLAEWLTGPSWAAFEYLPGDTVAEHTAAGCWPPDRAHGLLRGLGHVLGELRDAGVVHRDIKPSNIVLLESGPHLIDFGISHEHGDLTRITTVGKIIGTPSYMSPEQVKGEELTTASDVFSAAVTVLATMLGRSPFERGDIYPTLLAVTSDHPDLSGLGLDDDFRQLLSHALDKNPTNRPTPAQLGAGWYPAEWGTNDEDMWKTAQRQ